MIMNVKSNDSQDAPIPHRWCDATWAVSSSRVVGGLLRNRVRGALWTREHRVSRVVVAETFPLRVPVQLAFELHRHVVNQAGRARAVRDLHRCDRLAP